MIKNTLKASLFILFLLVFSNLAKGQSPYSFNWKQESIYGGIGAAALATGIYLDQRITPLSPEEIFALDRSTLNRLDRRATFYYSVQASDASDVFLVGSHLAPLLFLSHTDTRKDFGRIALLYGETLLLTDGLTGLTKRLAKRPRPFVYNELASMAKKQSKQARYAFFSGHTSVTAANCFFTAKVFSDYFPDSKLRPYVWGVASLAPAITGYLRVKAGKHYPSDVATGYAVGALIGFLVPHLHKKQRNKSWTIIPTSNGLYVRRVIP